MAVIATYGAMLELAALRHLLPCGGTDGMVMLVTMSGRVPTRAGKWELRFYQKDESYLTDCPIEEVVWRCLAYVTVDVKPKRYGAGGRCVPDKSWKWRSFKALCSSQFSKLNAQLSTCDEA